MSDHRPLTRGERSSCRHRRRRAANKQRTEPVAGCSERFVVLEDALPAHCLWVPLQLVPPLKLPQDPPERYGRGHVGEDEAVAGREVGGPGGRGVGRFGVRAFSRGGSVGRGRRGRGARGEGGAHVRWSFSVGSEMAAAAALPGSAFAASDCRGGGGQATTAFGRAAQPEPARPAGETRTNRARLKQKYHPPRDRDRAPALHPALCNAPGGSTGARRSGARTGPPSAAARCRTPAW